MGNKAGPTVIVWPSRTEDRVDGLNLNINYMIAEDFIVKGINPEGRRI